LNGPDEVKEALFYPPEDASVEVILNWKPPTTYHLVDLYLCLEILKAMPAFSRLDYDSKVSRARV
jgi:hypothetical protein